jgi:hypothetical protein
MFFSSINTAKFQQFLAAFMIPVFTSRWVKTYDLFRALLALKSRWRGGMEATAPCLALPFTQGKVDFRETLA